MVVIYMLAVQETIDQTRMPTKPIPRLSVWNKMPTGWQWIRHANLSPDSLALESSYGAFCVISF
jgi:hypothetical protein